MLSLFLRSRNQVPKEPESHPVLERDADRHSGTEQMTVATETAPDTAVDVPTGNFSGLLSAIIANAEFLEVLYGENQYLKNILNAAEKAQQQIHDAYECQ